MIALNLSPFEYITEEDKQLPIEQQTTFILRVLSAKEFAEEQSMIKLTEGTMDTSTLGSQTLLVLGYGLVGWKNLLDGQGGTIEFDKDKKIDLIDASTRYELFGQIMEHSTIGKSASKN